MQLLNPRNEVCPNVRSGLSLFVPSTGQKKAKSRERRTAFVQPSALSTVTGVGAQSLSRARRGIAPQRCPILRTREDIVPRLATLRNCQRRSRDIFNPVQRTFWNPDSRTSCFLVDSWIKKAISSLAISSFERCSISMSSWPSFTALPNMSSLLSPSFW